MKKLLLILLLLIFGCAEQQQAKNRLASLEVQPAPALSKEQIDIIQSFIDKNQISSENIPVLLSLLEISPQNANLFRPFSPSAKKSKPNIWDFLKGGIQAAHRGFQSVDPQFARAEQQRQQAIPPQQTSVSIGLRPLFNSQGQTIYFLTGNKRIVGLDGNYVAWVDRNGNVYDYQGEHKGWYQNGHIRGYDGGVIGYQRNAKNLGVIPPIPEIPPIPSIPKIEPIGPIPSIPPIKPISKMDWSEDELE